MGEQFIFMFPLLTPFVSICLAIHACDYGYCKITGNTTTLSQRRQTAYDDIKKHKCYENKFIFDAQLDEIRYNMCIDRLQNLINTDYYDDLYYALHKTDDEFYHKKMPHCVKRTNFQCRINHNKDASFIANYLTDKLQKS